MGDPAQDHITGQVAVGVVDLLEVVDVDQQKREGSAVALAARELEGQELLEVRVVVEAGETVGDGALAGILVEGSQLGQLLFLFDDSRLALALLEGEGHEGHQAREHLALGRGERLVGGEHEGAVEAGLLEERDAIGHAAVPIAFASLAFGHGLQHDLGNDVELALRHQRRHVQLSFEQDHALHESILRRQDLQDPLREIIDHQGLLADLLNLLHEEGQLRQVRLGLCRVRHAN
ncbi:hypothetical protein D3C72_1434010 [compost metagenome]